MQLKLKQPIPEMSLVDFARFFKDYFGIQAQMVPDKAYAVRLVGSPFNPFAEECRSITVYAHNRGAVVSPLNTLSVLEKFSIPLEDFSNAYQAFQAKRGEPSPVQLHKGTVH
jgi:hypothetical protein